MMGDNISFSLNEIEDDNDNYNNTNNLIFFNDLLDDTHHGNNVEQDFMCSQIINYKENYTINQLYQICEYYGIVKEMKLNKFKKEDVILVLVNYENNIENKVKVLKRKKMWHCINELKNDKFMKKYILWNC